MYERMTRLCRWVDGWVYFMSAVGGDGWMSV